MPTSARPAAQQHLTRTRLLRDVNELLSTSYQGIAVHVSETDITKLCLHISPSEGTFGGLTLHFEVLIPDTFPLSPPKVKCSTQIRHPNVFGGYICCDILKGEEEMSSMRQYEDTYTGGYTSAYSLLGIFMQLASFFSDERVEQEYGYVVDVSSWRNRKRMALESANTFSCKKCGYGITIPCEVGSPMKLVASSSSTSSTSAPHLKTLSRSALRRRRRRQNKPPVTSSMSPLAPEPSFVIDRLNNDCLLYILNFLPTTDILVFARAFKPVSTLIHQHNIIAHREIRCFALKKSSTETILGVGVSWSREEKALSSPFDYISVEAFETLGIRIGVRRERYSHFLPLAITASHFHKASPKILERLELLQKHIISEGGPSPARINGRSTSPYNYKTVCAFANNIVVRLMRSCDGPNGLRTGQTILHASERALTDYFSLMHLLISLACAYPSIIQSATLELQRFVRHPSKRVKAFTPNLGELIVQRVLVPGVSWEEMRLPLLGEALTRNVVWMLDGRQGAGCGELALLENESVSDYRLATTFRASRTSLKLLMFQHFFLETLRGLVAPGSDLPTLKNAIDSRYGLPPPEMPAQLVTAIQEIDAVDNFGAFSARLSLPRPTKSWMTSYLQDRIRDSERVGYHVFPDTLSRASFISWRAYKDPVWAAGYPKVRPVRPSHSELHSSFFLNSRRGRYG